MDQVRREDGYNAPAISEMNNINASSSAGNGRRNEEQQHNSDGAGDHSFDKAKDDDKEPLTWLKNGIYIVCTFFATFCMEAILNLPGGTEPMKMTDGQRQNIQSFLISDVSCFLLSVTAIFLVTISSWFPSKYSLHLNSIMIGALMASAISLFREVLVLSTDGDLAQVAFMQGFRSFGITMSVLIVVGLLSSKEFRSYIRKECC